MAKFHFDGDADVAKALQKLLSVAAAEKKIEDGAKKAAAAGKDAGDKMSRGADKSKSALEGVADKVFAVGAGYLSVSKGIAAARQELEAYMARQREAAQTSQTWSEARAQALEMWSDMDKAGDLDQIVAAASRASSIPQTEMWLGTGDVLSAALLATPQEVQAVLTEAGHHARVTGRGAEEIRGRGPYMLDVMAQTGTSSPREAMGSISSIAKAARVTDMALVAKNFVPGAVGYERFGDTFEASYGAMAGVSYILGDEGGAEVSTAYKMLRQKLTTVDVPGYGFLKAESTIGRIKELMPWWAKAGKAEQGKLLPKTARGGSMQTALTALLAGDATAWERIEEATAKVLAPGPESAAIQDAYFAAVGGVPEAAPGAFTHPFAETGERLQRNRVAGTMGVVGWDTFKKSLRDIGIPWYRVDRKLDMYATYGANWAVGADVHDRSEAAYRTEIGKIESRMTPYAIMAGRGPSDRDAELLDGLYMLLEALEKAQAGVSQALGGVEASAAPDNPNAQVE